MNKLHEVALHVINVMNTDLRFIVTADNILTNPVKGSTDICIRIDTDNEDFYHDFFANIYRQIQLLIALGEVDEASNYLEVVKNDLSRIIKEATGSTNTILFRIPVLEACLTLNPVE